MTTSMDNMEPLYENLNSVNTALSMNTSTASNRPLSIVPPSDPTVVTSVEDTSVSNVVVDLSRQLAVALQKLNDAKALVKVAKEKRLEDQEKMNEYIRDMTLLREQLAERAAGATVSSTSSLSLNEVRDDNHCVQCDKHIQLLRQVANQMRTLNSENTSLKDDLAHQVSEVTRISQLHQDTESERKQWEAKARQFGQGWRELKERSLEEATRNEAKDVKQKEDNARLLLAVQQQQTTHSALQKELGQLRRQVHEQTSIINRQKQQITHNIDQGKASGNSRPGIGDKSRSSSMSGGSQSSTESGDRGHPRSHSDSTGSQRPIAAPRPYQKRDKLAVGSTAQNRTSLECFLEEFEDVDQDMQLRAASETDSAGEKKDTSQPATVVAPPVHVNDPSAVMTYMEWQVAVDRCILNVAQRISALFIASKTNNFDALLPAADSITHETVSLYALFPGKLSNTPLLETNMSLLKQQGHDLSRLAVAASQNRSNDSIQTLLNCAYDTAKVCKQIRALLD